MTDLEQQVTDHLRRRAAEATPRYDLEGILGHHEAATVVDVSMAGRRRRTSVWMAVAAAVTLFVAGIALVRGGEGDPNVATDAVGPDDQALADRAVLTAEDAFGLAAASPEQAAERRAEEDSLAGCLGSDASERQVDRATARSMYVGEDNGNTEHFASTATVYSSEAEAHAVLAQMALPATRECYREVIERGILARARDGLTSITGRSLSVSDLEVLSSETDRLGLSHYVDDPPGAGYYDAITDDHQSFQVKTTLVAEDVTVDVYTAVAFFTKGPVAVQLSVQTYFTPFSRGTALGSLAKQILARLPDVGTADDGTEADDATTDTEEATITECGPPDEIGLVYVRGEVANSSYVHSDFLIQVAVEGPDGTQLGTGTASAEHVGPRQTARWEASTSTSAESWVDGTTCTVVDVERIRGA